MLLPPRSALGVASRVFAPRASSPAPTPSYSLLRQQRKQRRGVGRALQRHPFSGLLHSAGELLHTPERIPTSVATVLLSGWSNAFHGIDMSAHFGTLTTRPVHPASPVLLTKNGPLGTSIVRRRSIKYRTRILPIQSLRIGAGRVAPHASNHWLYRVELTVPAILRETSEGTSY